MAYSAAQLQALKDAYAEGALRVTFEGKTVEYASGDDLLKRIKTVETAIATEAAGGVSAQPVARATTFRRG